ncbi:MAG: T9SS type A sorting domain-containing protein [Bacteroidetes bacterium]|nr:T9SS type A sorting domain-containing protein [Bacteroidota bacterium]
MKNRHTFYRLSLSCFLGMLSFFFSLPSFAQFVDNPYLDQVPIYLRNAQTPDNGEQVLSTVITVNNWDNFNLAVDFGESNMAENPLAPPSIFTAYNTNAAHHTEDGTNWTNTSPSFGQTMQGDPVVCYDSLGNLFYQNMYGSSILGAMVIKSSNNGATWSPAVIAIAGNDKNWLACDQTSGPYANYVYCTMTNGGAGNFSRSTDHGVTFTSTFAPTTQSLPGMMVCVGPNGSIQGGNVYVVTNSGSAFASTYTFYRSTDGGATFTQMSQQSFSGYVGTNVNGRNSVQGMRTRPYPMIAADNSYGSYRGRLYNVYASNNPPGDANKPDIWCRYSDNNGTTWSSAVQVNDDVNPTSHHQWHPAIWCDKQTGRLYAMWMDTRDCPTNDSALIYATYSDNGGVSWSANQAVSNQKMKIDCPSCGGGGTPRYQGDYNGIISNKKGSMAGWTDFRQGSFMSVTAYYPDFAMSINHTADTLYVTSDSTDFLVNIPAVKGYSDTVVLSGQISPSPSPGTITFVYPQGNLITSFPGSKTVRVKLTGNVPLNLYTATFFAKGPNGTPVHQRTATIRVLASQGLGVTVSANPTTVCPGGSTQLQATPTGGTLPYTYAWTSNPAGFTSTLPNPVATPTVTTWYKCTVHDNINTTVKDSVHVTVTAVPAAPGTISGNATPCVNSTESYSITAVPNATTYNWTVPSGATVQSGQGTAAVTVLWGTTSGNVAVTAGNSCGTSAASTLAVTLSPLPPAPGSITGPTGVCENETATYSVSPVSGVTNNWTVPAGATIVSGQGTPSILVLWGSISGDVSVTAQNTCGNSVPSQLSVLVTTIPGAAQAIAGPDSVCQGQGGYPFSVPAIASATSYVWTLPQGAAVSQGQGTNSIVVDFNATALSGNVSVSGNNQCGTGTASSKYVKVLTCSGIYSNNLQSRIVIFPNPAHGLITLSVSGAEKNLRVRITDLSGRLLYDESMDNLPAEFTKQIDISGFAKGVYMISVTNDSRSFTGKITVN